MNKLIINYDIDKIREFLHDFYKITGLTISVWDSDMNQLAFKPSEMPEFCKLIKSSTLGKKRCLLSDKKIISDCKCKNSPTTHKCHAGLVDTAVPITFNDHTLGFIMFGQVKDKQFSDNSQKELIRLGQELKLPVDKLIASYNALKSFDTDIIDSAANILNSALLSLYINNYISFTENELVSAIVSYINNNIHTPISVTSICDEFSISKNKLYSLWRKWFGVTIGDYILNIRMKNAKNMLVNEDSKISRICIKVGIPDYNYFSKVFKKYYGVSPKEYRKSFLIILSSEHHKKKQ